MNSVNISCVIPTCDREELFNETLESVLNQTIKPLEIIIVNNGKVNLEDLYKKSVLIKVYNIINYAGVSQALNFGASIARGEYIAFLEDDDLWEKNYIKNLLDVINPDNQIYVSRIDKLYKNKITKYKNANNKINLKTLFIQNPGINISNLCVNKQSFINLSGFDTTIPVGADKSFAIDCLLSKLSFKVLEHNQEICRFHDGYRISKNPKKLIQSHIAFYKKYKKIMNYYQKFFLLYKIFFLIIFKKYNIK